VLRLDFSERPSATDATNSVQHAMKADGGSCKGGVWQTLGSFLYSNSDVAPLYKTFPYQDPQPLAAKTISGGGIYVAMTAGEGFTYQIAFKSGAQTQSASGSAPNTSATSKVPSGFGTGTATIVLTAETNPDRQSTVTLDLGTGQVSSGGGSSGGKNSGGGSKPKPVKPAKCKKGQKSSKLKPCTR